MHAQKAVAIPMGQSLSPMLKMALPLLTQKRAGKALRWLTRVDQGLPLQPHAPPATQTLLHSWGDEETA